MRIAASSQQAQQALNQLTTLQRYFVEQLQQVATQASLPTEFTAVEWLRDQGQHGGGERFEAQPNGLFNRASVNVSQIQYENNPDKSFASATALSTIIHPDHPLAPSIHIHVSWTELKSGKKYWRIMADLNPAIEDKTDTTLFLHMLEQASGEFFHQGIAAGDEYFNIPVLKKRRGVAHFYLEGFVGNETTPENYAIDFAKQVIDCYIKILSKKSTNMLPATAEQKQLQLNYHTLYFFQVLTLDKGTTAGLLIHNQNDVGTLGSIPAHINRELLTQWANVAPEPLNALLASLLAVVPKEKVAAISSEVKAEIAQALRQHYQTHPLN